MNEKGKAKPFYGFKNDNKEEKFVLVYEIWDNFYPDKLYGGEVKKYVSGMLSEQQLAVMIPFWIELGKDAKDPVFSLQLEIDGGSTVLFRYEDDRQGPPPNSSYRIIKPIFDKKICKLLVAGEQGKTFIFHTSINKKEFSDDVKYFASVIEKIVFNNVLEDIFATEDEFTIYSEKQMKVFDQYGSLLSNTFVIDRRTDKYN